MRYFYVFIVAIHMQVSGFLENDSLKLASMKRVSTTLFYINKFCGSCLLK